MSLYRVTITGADDQTNIRDLIDLSDEYRFVEWGILVSKKQEGSVRFPSKSWMMQFAKAAAGSELKVSTHLCGAWVRKLLLGKLDWSEVPEVVNVSRRVQINTHAEIHESSAEMIDNISQMYPREVIFQWDGVNNHFAYAMKGQGLQIEVLFDTSGGAGVVPKNWPQALGGFQCGYAGGLGPENVSEKIAEIRKICGAPFWIDMERRVRTEDDSRLDIEKVRKVLELCKPEVTA